MKDIYNYEFEDSKYCYPQTDVLINKLEIKEPDKFYNAERDITSITILELQENPLPGCFDLKYLRDIHRLMFQDIYSWAGQLRTVDISKGNKFCPWQNIESFAADIFNKLNELRKTHSPSIIY
ncbi:MAG: Fic family protein [Peptostreptococcaceae bacterium]|nr:Fic family protein [Peptostreptococcaceae bacterium]